MSKIRTSKTSWMNKLFGVNLFCLKTIQRFRHLSLLRLKILWRSAQVTDGSLVDGQNFDFKEFSLDAGLLSSIQKMKIFERLLDKFLIFAQFIQIDAIVGGYEASPYRNALRNHFVTCIFVTVNVSTIRYRYFVTKLHFTTSAKSIKPV